MRGALALAAARAAPTLGRPWITSHPLPPLQSEQAALEVWPHPSHCMIDLDWQLA